MTKKMAYLLTVLDRESLKAKIENRIKAWGMFTPRREVTDTRSFVWFGASEILSFGLAGGLPDAVVLASDGAGTLIATRPELVRGIGGSLSGLVKTVPYNEVIRRIGKNGGIVIDKARASLIQPAGVVKAYELGYKNLVVTVERTADAKTIRKLYSDAMIFENYSKYSLPLTIKNKKSRLRKSSGTTSGTRPLPCSSIPAGILPFFGTAPGKKEMAIPISVT
nr:DUF2099 family protein [Methanoregula sp. PtaU1.Bin006]